eukprot:TRINITY_DN11412_c0_g1_i4.p1 TRINITY_DN11412_c0_g1~~TRINITY_DN11412_c0_g1_i4.p1  ORF type:complete len:323 (+),score=61.76 TRINITY_DN11412_c0_g1_i4:264-1232(+)
MDKEGNLPVIDTTTTTSPRALKPTTSSSHGTAKPRIVDAPLKSRPLPPLQTNLPPGALKKLIISRNVLKHSITPEPWQRCPRQASADLSSPSELGSRTLRGPPVSKEYLKGVLRSLNERSQKFSEERQALEERIRAKTALRGHEFDVSRWNVQELEKLPLRRQSYDMADTSFSMSTREVFTKACNYIGADSPRIEQMEITPKITKELNNSNDATTATKMDKPAAEKKEIVEEAKDEAQNRAKNLIDEKSKKVVKEEVKSPSKLEERKLKKKRSQDSCNMPKALVCIFIALGVFVLYFVVFAFNVEEAIVSRIRCSIILAFTC